MVTVIMADHNLVDLLYIDIEFVYVMEQDLTLSSGIEQYGLFCPFDQTGKSPICLSILFMFIVIVEDREF